MWARDAYAELPAAPEPLNHAQLVECHDCEQNFGTVGIAELPGEQPPELTIVEQVRADLDPAEDLRVRQAGEESSSDNTEDEQS